MPPPDRCPYKCSICKREFPSHRSVACHFAWCDMPNRCYLRSTRKKVWKWRLQNEARKRDGRQHEIKINKRTYFSKYQL